MPTKSEIRARLEMVNASPEDRETVEKFMDEHHDAFIEGIPVPIARIFDKNVDRAMDAIKDHIDRIESNGLHKYQEDKKSDSPKRDFSWIEDASIRATAEHMFPREDSVWLGGPTWEQGQVLNAIRNRK